MDFVLQRGAGLLEDRNVLFDRYQTQSIKATTRSRLPKNMVQIVGRGIAETRFHSQYFLPARRQKSGS